eukprot:573550-Pyramimonas_sp.AAC.1
MVTRCSWTSPNFFLRSSCVAVMNRASMPTRAGKTPWMTPSRACSGRSGGASPRLDRLESRCARPRPAGEPRARPDA